MFEVGGDISVVLFKLVLYHVEHNTLPNGWNRQLEKAIEGMKNLDYEKWIKLQKYCK
jgi:hypothetical protein